MGFQFSDEISNVWVNNLQVMIKELKSNPSSSPHIKKVIHNTETYLFDQSPIPLFHKVGFISIHKCSQQTLGNIYTRQRCQQRQAQDANARDAWKETDKKKK